MIREARQYAIPKAKLVGGYAACLIGGWLVGKALLVNLLGSIPAVARSGLAVEDWLDRCLGAIPLIGWLGGRSWAARVEATAGLALLIVIHVFLRRTAQRQVLQKFIRRHYRPAAPAPGTPSPAPAPPAASTLAPKSAPRPPVWRTALRGLSGMWWSYPIATFLLARSTLWFPALYSRATAWIQVGLINRLAQQSSLGWVDDAAQLALYHPSPLTRILLRSLIGLLLVRAVGVPLIYNRLRQRRGPLLRVVKFNYHTLPRRKLSWLNWRLGRFPLLQKGLDRSLNRMLRRVGDFDIDLTTKVAEGVDPDDRILGYGTSTFYDRDSGEQRTTHFYMAENLRERLRRRGDITLSPEQLQGVVRALVELGRQEAKTLNSQLLAMWRSDAATWKDQLQRLALMPSIVAAKPRLRADDIDQVIQAIIALGVADPAELDSRHGIRELLQKMRQMDLVGGRGRFLRVIYVPEGGSIVRHVVMEEDIEKEHSRSKAMLGDEYPRKILTSMKYMKAAGEMASEDIDGGTEAYISADEIEKGFIRSLFQWGRIYKINNYHRRKYDIQSAVWESGTWLAFPLRWATGRDLVPRRKLIVRDDATGVIVAEAAETWFACLTKVIGNYNRILHIYDNGIENNEGFHNYGGQNLLLGASEFDRLNSLVKWYRTRPGSTPLELLEDKG